MGGFENITLVFLSDYSLCSLEYILNMRKTGFRLCQEGDENLQYVTKYRKMRIKLILIWAAGAKVNFLELSKNRTDSDGSYLHIMV